MYNKSIKTKGIKGSIFPSPPPHPLPHKKKKKKKKKKEKKEKKDILFIQGRFNKLIYGINTIKQCGI